MTFGALHHPWALLRPSPAPDRLIIDPSRPALGWVLSSSHCAGSTLRRCVTFARRWGYGSVNIAGLHSSTLTGDPGSRAASLGQDAPLDEMVAACDLIVLAWGADVDPCRARQITATLWSQCTSRGGSLGVLGWTHNGQPSQPHDVAPATVPECFTTPPCPEQHEWWATHEADDSNWSQLLSVP
ncbi:hypothetical protein B7435_07265 [Mycolicibacterium peregrinum]|uniref:DUF1643 domain-containing protein n=1 Tax=Mycolicibacterium peregrinum TaxID=43304 RepID=UPI000B4AC765|nr:DUF1643 domain-containing protein [Mycolicibacterium peregrinum]OWM07720.1 hypothetical protein B7435_07265 [Mycolicibacterium peregrinum]